MSIKQCTLFLRIQAFLLLAVVKSVWSDYENYTRLSVLGRHQHNLDYNHHLGWSLSSWAHKLQALIYLLINNVDLVQLHGQVDA